MACLSVYMYCLTVIILQQKVLFTHVKSENTVIEHDKLIEDVII